MAKRYIGRFTKGRGGLGRMFKRNRRLRRLSAKTKKQALKTLGKYSQGKGIDTGEELKDAYGEWRRDKDDAVSTAEARLIRDELRREDKTGDQADPTDRPTSRLSIRPQPKPDFGDDPRANLDERPADANHSDDPRDPSNWQDPPTDN